MTLQRIIEEIENIMDQASADDDINKDKDDEVIESKTITPEKTDIQDK